MREPCTLMELGAQVLELAPKLGFSRKDAEAELRAMQAEELHRAVYPICRQLGITNEVVREAKLRVGRARSVHP